MQVKNCYLLPRDRQLEEPVAYCDVCGAELYEGEQAFYDNGQEILCCKGLCSWCDNEISCPRNSWREGLE